MSANTPHAALATLDLIERLDRYRTRLLAFGRASALTELDQAIEQARVKLTSLRAPDAIADPSRFAELTNERRPPSPLTIDGQTIAMARETALASAC